MGNTRSCPVCGHVAGKDGLIKPAVSRFIGQMSELPHTLRLRYASKPLDMCVTCVDLLQLCSSEGCTNKVFRLKCVEHDNKGKNLDSKLKAAAGDVDAAGELPGDSAAGAGAAGGAGGVGAAGVNPFRYIFIF